jgi:hypothetical protein
MLPFLKKNISQPGMITQQRSPDSSLETEEDDSGAGISAAAQDLIDAVHAKDSAGVASALKAAFDILDSEPHEENEHNNDEPMSGAI